MPNSKYDITNIIASAVLPFYELPIIDSSIYFCDLTFKVRDHHTSETIALCKIDFLSERSDPIGFLGISIRRCMVIENFATEIYATSRLGKLIENIFKIKNLSNAQIEITNASIKFENTNAQHLELNYCRLQLGNAIRFKSGNLQLLGIDQPIEMQNGILEQGDDFSITLYYQRNGTNQTCRIAPLK